MNWDAIGSIGEIAGAIAVVATLIYFSRQIRDNQTISTTGNTVSVLGMRIHHREVVNSNIEIWEKGNAGKELTSSESGIYRNLLENYDMIAFLNFFQRQSIEGEKFNFSNSIPVAEFSFFLHQNPGARAVWEEIQERHSQYRSALISSPRDGGQYVQLVRSNLEKLEQAGV